MWRHSAGGGWQRGVLRLQRTSAMVATSSCRSYYTGGRNNLGVLVVPQQQVFVKKPPPPPAMKKPADPAAEIRAVEASEQGAAPTMLSWEEAEARLREWDMSSRFGPCMSMTRLERWNRASKLELDPPVFIRNVMEAFPELKDKSVWHNRVHPDDPIIGV